MPPRAGIATSPALFRSFSTGTCMLAHPSKRKHGMPGEDAFFVHDGGSIVVIGVADGTSVAGACVRVCARARARRVPTLLP